MVVPLALESGEICTGRIVLQPISLKSDRLLALARSTEHLFSENGMNKRSTRLQSTVPPRSLIAIFIHGTVFIATEKHCYNLRVGLSNACCESVRKSSLNKGPRILIPFRNDSFQEIRRSDATRTSKWSARGPHANPCSVFSEILDRRVPVARS